MTDHFRANPAATRAAFARHVAATASARPSTNGATAGPDGAATAGAATAGAAASPGQGRLLPRELARLLLDCVPGLNEEQLRYVMTHMSQ